MASETNSTASPHVSIHSESKTQTPRFAVCEILSAIESGETDEWDDTDWQDYLSQFADTGVRQ